MMIREFLSPFTDVRHVAIGAGHSALGMYSQPGNFIIRMLGFQQRSFAQCMCPVSKSGFIIIFFYGFNAGPIVPWESEVLPFTFEIILHMTLCAHQASHILVSHCFYIFPLALKCLN